MLKIPFRQQRTKKPDSNSLSTLYHLLLISYCLLLVLITYYVTHIAYYLIHIETWIDPLIYESIVNCSRLMAQAQERGSPPGLGNGASGEGSARAKAILVALSHEPQTANH